MSMALVLCGWMLLLMTPNAVVLSVLMGVLGCLWPISVRSWRIGTASHALMYSALSLALGCTGHDCLEYFGDVENGSIVGWIVDVGGAEKMTTSLAACVGFAEVGCIAVHGKDHVTAFVREDGIWIG
jgi:hypothetical protein